MKKIYTFLIAVSLVIGMVGCGEVIDNGDGNGNGNGAVSYELTVSSTSGGSVVEPSEGVHTYEEGTVVDLVAEPDTGYRFVDWTGDVGTVSSVTAASTTMTMNGDYSVTASFEEMAPAEYTLTISSTAGGSVTTPGEGAFTYEGGTLVDLVAEAEEGYRFDRWTGDVTTVLHVSLASTTVTVRGDYSITAKFVRAIDYSALGKITRIEADPENGFHFAYYLYVPTSLRRLAEEGQTICILVEPNNTGFISDDQEVHDSAALRLMNRRTNYAEQLRVPLLVPTFPRPATEWRLYMQALDRNTMLSTVEAWKRVDLQLLAMVDDASHRLSEIGVIPHRRILMMGYSASGMFVSRFVVMHPDRIQAAAIGSPGGWPIAPIEQWEDVSLRYPIGVADLEELTGREFDVEQFRAVPLYFYLGDMDTNDSVPFTDGWDPEDQILIFKHFGETPVERWPLAEQIYGSVGCDSQFKLYPGVGHEITSAMLADIGAFFLDNM